MKGPQKIEVPYGTHRIEYATTGPILLTLNGTPETVINGKGKLLLRGMEGAIETNPTDKGEYKLSITTKARPKDEIRNDAPPPEPPAPTNYLQALRQRVRDEMGSMTERFGPTPYERDYNDGMFEEQRYAPKKQPQHAEVVETQTAGQPEGENGTPEKKAVDTPAEDG